MIINGVTCLGLGSQERRSQASTVVAISHRETTIFVMQELPPLLVIANSSRRCSRRISGPENLLIVIKWLMCVSIELAEVQMKCTIT